MKSYQEMINETAKWYVAYEDLSSLDSNALAHIKGFRNAIELMFGVSSAKVVEDCKAAIAQLRQQ